MIITKEEFDNRLDTILINYIILYLQVKENPSINRKPQQEAKQALRQLMLDVISDLEEEAECMPKPSGDYVDVLPFLHIEELREIVKGE